jgi:hypothetical protein
MVMRKLLLSAILTLTAIGLLASTAYVFGIPEVTAHAEPVGNFVAHAEPGGG